MEFVEWNRYFRGRPRLDALVARASAADRKPIFMVGSGLSLPEEPGGPGVPGTAGMVELVREQVSDDQATLDELNRRLERAEQDNASVYGEAFAFLRDWRGPDAANQVILDAVRMARLPRARQSDDAQALESDLEGWALTRGTSALGFLLAGHQQSYPGPVLTTNFDPLLSVAISRAHGHPRRVILDGDGRLPSAAELGPDITPVIHLHGYWWGSDTHHTGMELSASRPQLGASLARLLNERLVVVVGYGGWDDAFMQAVSSLLDDTGARPDIAWALYDDDPGMILTRHAPLLDHFERWRFRSRFTLYVGIDANKFFQKLLDRALGSTDPVDPDGRPSARPPADRLHESVRGARGLLVDDLRGELARGRVIVLAGAGVSVGASGGAAVASWTGLLKDGVARCEELALRPLPAGWGDRVRAQIQSGDVEELLLAAEAVTGRLGGRDHGEYRRWLRETVGALNVTQPGVLEALRDLGGILATTNYDGLLEQVTGLPAVTWRDLARAHAVLRGDEQAILHLHGFWQEPGSVVLGVRSYEQLLGAEHAQAIQQVMAAMGTLLFVGFGAGLADPNFAALRAWMGRMFRGGEYRHFRLAKDDEVAALRAEHGQDERVFVLGYGPSHAHLAPFLRRLTAAQPTPGPEATGPPPPPRLSGKSDVITGADGGAGSGAPPGWRWDVALSFAGAQRDYVEQVARALAGRGIRCFYDADEQIDLWGKYLAEELPAIYAEQAAAVVVFISADYAARDWTRLERRAALNRAVRERREYVLPAGSMTRRCPGCCRTWSRSTCAAGRRSSSPP